MLALLGTLARMALPALSDRMVSSRAGEVAAAIATLDDAAERYWQQHLRWPPDGYVGTAPDGLAAFLPDGFSLEGSGYRLDWENWSLVDGLPADSEARGVLAVTVVTDDRALGRALVERLGPTHLHLALGDRYTFVTDRR